MTKLVISTGVLIITPILSVPRVLAVIERLRSAGDPESLSIEIVAVSVATVVTLTGVTAISVFKPWGRTRWGGRTRTG